MNKFTFLAILTAFSVCSASLAQDPATTSLLQLQPTLPRRERPARKNSRRKRTNAYNGASRHEGGKSAHRFSPGRCTTRGGRKRERFDRGNESIGARPWKCEWQHFNGLGDIAVLGEMNGDVSSVSGTITVLGVVNGNASVVGGNLRVAGKVTGNASVVGGALDTAPGGQVLGNSSSVGAS